MLALLVTLQQWFSGQCRNTYLLDRKHIKLETHVQKFKQHITRTIHLKERRPKIQRGVNIQENYNHRNRSQMRNWNCTYYTRPRCVHTYGFWTCTEFLLESSGSKSLPPALPTTVDFLEGSNFYSFTNHVTKRHKNVTDVLSGSRGHFWSPTGKPRDRSFDIPSEREVAIQVLLQRKPCLTY